MINRSLTIVAGAALLGIASPAPASAQEIWSRPGLGSE